MRQWEAELYGDVFMSLLEERIAEVYNAAIKTGIKNAKGFFRKLQKLLDQRDEMAKRGMGSEEIEKEISNRMAMLMREENLIAQMYQQLQAAGQEIAQEIEKAMAEIYMINGNATLDDIGEASGIKFSQLRRDQVEIILADEKPFMSKIAYNNLRKQPATLRTLQNEFAQACALGEGQKKIIARTRKVTGMSAYQAKRVAQTERTRVQSQARYQAGQKAVNAGVRICAEWHCKFNNSRDAHMERHLQVVIYGEVFPDSVMRYPGDPNGGAKEVINCHCYLSIRVLLDDEDVVDNKIVRRAA